MFYVPLFLHVQGMTSLLRVTVNGKMHFKMINCDFLHPKKVKSLYLVQFLPKRNISYHNMLNYQGFKLVSIKIYFCTFVCFY